MSWQPLIAATLAACAVVTACAGHNGRPAPSSPTQHSPNRADPCTRAPQTVLVDLAAPGSARVRVTDNIGIAHLLSSHDKVIITPAGAPLAPGTQNDLPHAVWDWLVVAPAKVSIHEVDSAGHVVASRDLIATACR